MATTLKPYCSQTPDVPEFFRSEIDEKVTTAIENLKIHRNRLRKVIHESTLVQPTKLEIEEAKNLIQLLTKVEVDANNILRNTTSIKAYSTNVLQDKSESQLATPKGPLKISDQRSKNVADKKHDFKPPEAKKSTSDEQQEEKSHKSTIPLTGDQPSSKERKHEVGDLEIPVTVLRSKIVSNEKTSDESFEEAMRQEIETHAAKKEKKLYQKRTNIEKIY